MSLKNKVLLLVSKRERLFRYLFRLLLSLLGFMVLRSSYGFMGAISGIWIPLALGVVCSFLPVNVMAFVMAVYLGIQLFAVGIDVCLVFLAVCLLVYLVAKAFGSRHTVHLIFTSVLYELSVPFLAPLYEGLFGKKREASSIIGGALVASLLRVIRLSATGIKNDENQSAFTLVRDNVLSNPVFYLLLISMAATFVVIYLVRRIRTRFAWMYAVVFGIAVEIIMTTTVYLLTGNSSRISTMIIGSVITLAIGLVITYFCADVRINHQKDLDFEDDEYYYHVICTPKIQLTDDSKKRVQRITTRRHKKAKTPDEYANTADLSGISADIEKNTTEE